MWRVGVGLTVTAMLLLPVVFLLNQGAFTIIDDQSATAADRLYPFVRLLGMLVFTGVMLQILSQTLWVPLTKLYTPKALLVWHVTVGLLTYGLALLHPILFDLTQWLATGSLAFLKDFLPRASMGRFNFLVMLGYLNLILLSLTVGAGLLRKQAFIRRWWKKVHLLNYLVFAIGFYHSLNIGTDTQTPPIRTVWFIYAGLVIGAVLWRLGELYVKHQRRKAPQA